jgi:hypothetical protein
MVLVGFRVLSLGPPPRGVYGSNQHPPPPLSSSSFQDLDLPNTSIMTQNWDRLRRKGS